MQETYDVIIAGGAVMGSSTAYHLAASPDFRGRILVIDKDLSFQKCASALSASSIRQQYSTKINIHASLFGLWFIQHVGDLLAVDGERPALGFKERGYLYLAGSGNAHVLETNHVLQKAEGANIRLLDRAALAHQFPWLALDDVALGSWGASGEGWFDGYGLMQALRKKAIALGVTYAEAKVVGLDWSGDRVSAVRLDDGRTIGCGAFVNTCGASGARALAAIAGCTLPISSRKRCVFAFTYQGGIGPEHLARFPLVIDTTGVWFRTEGSGFLTGISPPEIDDPETDDFEVDWPMFEEILWPALAARVPAFAAIKPGRAWACHYDLNTFDHNALAGRVPGRANVYVAAGFSGHGLQQSPAIGRGLSELIVHGRFTTLDLSDFAVERVATGLPLFETNVI
jgi:FAD-dependent oxidoreductase domain-containing protein 1